jgi:hypothetical protein
MPTYVYACCSMRGGRGYAEVKNKGATEIERERDSNKKTENIGQRRGGMGGEIRKIKVKKKRNLV